MALRDLCLSKMVPLCLGLCSAQAGGAMDGAVGVCVLPPAVLPSALQRLILVGLVQEGLGDGRIVE